MVLKTTKECFRLQKAICIDDYYEKIRFGKQEKPFHEIIICLNKQERTKVNGVMNAQDKITRRTTQ